MIIPDIRIKTFDKKQYNDGAVVSSKITSNDLILVPNAYDSSTYFDLICELDSFDEKLFVKWHKDSHYIANDRFNNGQWKNNAPTFNYIIDDVCKKFNVIPNATRVNVYRSGENGIDGTSDTKPFHHDRSAFTPGLSQNITIAVSFGATREVAFKHVKKKVNPFGKWIHNKEKTIISFECTNGSIYAFTRDVNCEFQHGVLPSINHDETEDRISIIIWGTKTDLDVSNSRVSHEMIPSAFELGKRKKKRNRNNRYINNK